MAGSGRDSEIEWLDADPPPVPDETQAPRLRLHWWYALIALAVVVGLVVAVRPDHSRSTADRTSSPAPPSSAPTSTGPTVDVSASPTTTTLGRAVLDVAPTWQLFGRGSGSVVRIDLAAGRVVTTPIPLLSSSGPASFLAGPDRVIIRPLNLVTGYDVRDGQPYERLSTNFPDVGPALPGPDADDLWVPGRVPGSMALVRFDGSPTGTVVELPQTIDATAVGSDAAGYLQFRDTTGVYEVRPSGIARITRGALLAAGPTVWLTEECDVNYLCMTTVINRRTGARHTLDIPADALAGGAVISPDGRTLAVLGAGGSSARIHLIDLDTGSDLITDVGLDPGQNYQDGLFVWSPDSRWLFATNAIGRLYAVDGHTGATTQLPLTLGPISQLALRT